MGNNASIVDCREGDAPAFISQSRTDSVVLASAISDGNAQNEQQPEQSPVPLSKESKRLLAKSCASRTLQDSKILASTSTTVEVPSRLHKEQKHRPPGRSWPKLSRQPNLRPAPVDIPVSGGAWPSSQHFDSNTFGKANEHDLLPESRPHTQAHPDYIWSDVRVEDFIPPAPPPIPDSDDDLDHNGTQRRSRQGSVSTDRRASLFRSLSMRESSGNDKPAEAGGGNTSFMRSKSKSRKKDQPNSKASGRAYSLSAVTASHSFGGEGYVPQVIER